MRIENSRETTRGFSLVELLVVIAIIAVLAGLLMPVLSKAKERARRVDCVSHMRQLSLATMLSNLDNEDYYPWRSVDTDWWPQITGYLDGKKDSNLLLCPSDRDSTSLPRKILVTDLPPRSYVMNGFADAHLEASGSMSWLSEKTRFSESRITEPTRTIIFGEKKRFGQLAWVDVVPVSSAFLDILAENRHLKPSAREGSIGGEANYVFADGHISSIGFGKATCPENLWCVTSKWRTNAALCVPRF